MIESNPNRVAFFCNTDITYNTCMVIIKVLLLGMKIKHGEITTEKIVKVWIASVLVTKPMKMEANMQGKTKEIAIEKLQLFLAGKPYSHLDK